MVKPKLLVSRSDDPFEREADRIADRVMRTKRNAVDKQPGDGSLPSMLAAPRFQRKCAPCEEEESHLQRAADAGDPRSVTSDFQSKLKRGNGLPLPPGLLQDMRARMGADFSDVRVHVGGAAHEMSQSINAKAFTLGRDIYFRDGNYDPVSSSGKTLLAHELAHTLQQDKAARKIHRMLLYPIKPKPARIGDDIPEGGLLHDDENQRPSAIVDSKTTIRSIAELILPWFNNASPSANAKTSAPKLIVDDLARALVVFNDSYLPVSDTVSNSMTNFRIGLRMPLPVLIQTNGDWVVNPSGILSMAQRFHEAWAPYLDQKPKAAAIPADFAAETDRFMRDYPSLLKRAARLWALMLTNPTEALPLIKALFQRSDVGYELAIEVMKFLVLHQTGMLASLEKGYQIIGTLYTVINSAPKDLPQEMLEAAASALRKLGQFAVPAIAAEPTSVQARDTGGEERSIIKVTGVAPNSTVAPTVRAEPFSGGHDHDDNRRVGTLNPASVKAGRDGKAEFLYRSNTPGGEEIVSINVGGQITEVHVDVEVPGLIELPAGTNYDLTGNTTQHNSPHNHFGMPDTIQALQNIATEYEAYRTDHNYPDWPRIGYNDISLPRGGVFDINGGWTPPHNEHRLGLSVDFRLGYNQQQRTVLRDIITRHGATILDEGNHWHLRF